MLNRATREVTTAPEGGGVDANRIDCLLDTKAAAARVCLSPVTMERLRVTGEGPRFAKLGKSVRYRSRDLDDWVLARLIASTSQTVEG